MAYLPQHPRDYLLVGYRQNTRVVRWAAPAFLEDSIMGPPYDKRAYDKGAPLWNLSHGDGRAAHLPVCNERSQIYLV